jgi:hypothetical protein
MSVNILTVVDEADAAELFRQHFRREVRQGQYVLHFAYSAEEAFDPCQTETVYSETSCSGARRAEVFAKRMGSDCAVGRQALETNHFLFGLGSSRTRTLRGSSSRANAARANGRGAKRYAPLMEE